MRTTEEFEKALLSINVVIDEFSYKAIYVVKKAYGTVNGKAYRWNCDGTCVDRKGKRYPEYDLKF